MSVHIGQKIREAFENKPMTVKEFAEKIGYSRRNVYVIFDRSHIDTDLLQRISKVLEHDFFQYFLPEHQELDEPAIYDEPGGPREYYINKIKSLQSKIKDLEKELEYLREINRLLKEKLGEEG